MAEQFYDGETFEFTHKRKTYVATIERDDSHGAPWEEEDGHGPVSDWTTRDKLPGELVLSEDRGSKRFYDFAAACKQARKEGWGFLPGELICDRFAHSGKRKFRAFVAGRLDLTAYGKDQNDAIRKLYEMHHATMTARQYAAGAAMRNFEYLKAWCEEDWFYCGVVVTEKGKDESERLCGIESNAGDYIRDVARELAEQLRG